MRIETPVTATSRLLPGYRDMIQTGLSLVPEQIRDMVAANFVTGLDPAYVGLHFERGADDGRPYRDTAHVAYAHHQALPRSQARTTIVIPEPPSTLRVGSHDWWGPYVVVHEFAHMLHERFRWEPEFAPVNEYASSSSLEAFAEAFAYWIWDEADVYEKAPEAVAFFRSLTR